MRSASTLGIYIIRWSNAEPKVTVRRYATRKGKVLRLAVGVILNLIITIDPFLLIILMRVTPTANRNSYRVARLVGQLPRVACFARNPGL